MKSPGGPVQVLSADESAHLATIRADAVTAMTTTLGTFTADGPTDALGVLAWLAGALGTGIDNPIAAKALTKAVDQARDERYSWRQISDALGEGNTDIAGRRVFERFKRFKRRG